MVELRNKFSKDELTIIAVSTLNSKKLTENYLKGALGGKEATFPTLFAGRRVQKAFKGRGVPNTFIVDKQGMVRYRHRGFNVGLKKFIELEIKSLMDAV